MKTAGVFSFLGAIMLGCIAVMIIPGMTLSQQKSGGNDQPKFNPGQDVPRISMKKAKDKSKGDDKTLSPYFYVNSGDASVESLPMKSTSADVSIVGVIADVKVTQVYMNTGRKPIEAIYIFPASTRAAVYSMTMFVGKRMLTAKIAEKQQARQDYEQARQDGKSATLLEQQRPNVFQMNVANV